MENLIAGLRILQAYGEDVYAYDDTVVVPCHTEVYEHDKVKLRLMGWVNYLLPDKPDGVHNWEYCL